MSWGLLSAFSDPAGQSLGLNNTNILRKMLYVFLVCCQPRFARYRLCRESETCCKSVRTFHNIGETMSRCEGQAEGQVVRQL
jgi:hypothetical protein